MVWWFSFFLWGEREAEGRRGSNRCGDKFCDINLKWFWSESGFSVRVICFSFIDVNHRLVPASCFNHGLWCWSAASSQFPDSIHKSARYRNVSLSFSTISTVRCIGLLELRDQLRTVSLAQIRSWLGTQFALALDRRTRKRLLPAHYNRLLFFTSSQSFHINHHVRTVAFLRPTTISAFG